MTSELSFVKTDLTKGEQGRRPKHSGRLKKLPSAATRAKELLPSRDTRKAYLSSHSGPCGDMAHTASIEEMANVCSYKTEFPQSFHISAALGLHREPKKSGWKDAIQGENPRATRTVADGPDHEIRR